MFCRKMKSSKYGNKGEYTNEKYSLHGFGYLEDLDNITEENLYEYYKDFIKTSGLDIKFKIISKNSFYFFKVNITYYKYI